MLFFRFGKPEHVAHHMLGKILSTAGKILIVGQMEVILRESKMYNPLVLLYQQEEKRNCYSSEEKPY